ncbi:MULTISPECIES: hypothetical protein [Bacillaceae]|uniref:Uncharacterized protein n=2 Tax=Bacillus infantis TaxID=324767 RepID=U5LB91_9BACI|nr:MULTISPECIES: hypothetical protein [Bacillus]AGX04668.1 hypothetical protein N288_13830 [Bacillus infantis NRRL B-14911]EAR68259.1 hypothetical protein B14911_26410 [Bacillus sp. NRRL B-14911]MCK6205576.1 hypothetical protein [Bacillus infantis]MCP1158755.1 hypothetical protein [Bacillus infantis]MDT0163378.1 hypothetical protein [Bacillus sp. AG4(2022)]
MEEDHLNELLKILEKYPQTEITLTLSTQQNIPYAIINYVKNVFVLVDQGTQMSSVYTDKWTLISAIQSYWDNKKKLAGA